LRVYLFERAQVGPLVLLKLDSVQIGNLAAVGVRCHPESEQLVFALFEEELEQKEM